MAIANIAHDPLMSTTPSMRQSLVFVLPTLSGGGAERVITTLLHHLNRDQFALTLVVVNMGDGTFRKSIPPDVVLINLEKTRLLFALPALFALIRRDRPDVVVSTIGHINMGIGMLRLFLPRQIRFIARESSIVSEVLKHRQRFSWIWAMGYRIVYPMFDKLICQSEYMREDLVSNFGLAHHKTVVINNPLDIESIKSMVVDEPENKLLELRNSFPVLFVAAGRFVHVKGFDLLINALAIIARDDVCLCILGNGPLASSLQTQVNKLGLGQQVFFAGFQENPYPWLASADAFILSSRYEGFPNVVLESLACGTPVIAVPAPGGLREILTDISGCEIADAVSAAALASTINRWMTGKMSRIECKVIKKYDANIIAKYYEMIFLDKSTSINVRRNK